ncbi:MAG: mechanosensitive ion channel family protein [Candidatus Omnitrophica bacterium]|nr:mechanosensitive ion channel family protein [Candidatus Omnitrophota bacterium]
MMEKTLQTIIFNNRILDYCINLLIFLVAILFILAFKKFILIRLRKWADKTATTLDDFLISIMQHYVYPVLYFAALYLSVHNLVLPSRVDKTINVLGMVIVSIFVIRALIAAITYVFHNYLTQKEKNETRERSFKGILSVVKVIIWGVGIVFLLDNLGFKVSAIVAGLGIGGIAVALAAQAVLGDLFSYLAILLDRPFEIGDFIVVGDYLGTIEHVGIKTTRIRSLGGEQIVFSNTDLTNSRMRNYKRMDKRRIVFTLRVTYQTTLAHTKEIPVIIKKIIGDVKDAFFDRAHFFAFGDFSLIFEIVYYVASQDYNKYMDIQQEINFAIKEEFAKRGIEFAYPTQTLHIEK